MVALAWLVGGTSAQATGISTLVSLNFTNFGTVQLDLFDDSTSNTVANFLHYVNSGSYTNTMVHRVDTGLGVIQGGGFDLNGNGITTFAGIPLVYTSANKRGTIAMARTGDTQAGTQGQWFINTKDNTTALGASNGGGYAVFGWVVGPGMSVVDAIAAVPTFSYNSPFNQIPLTNFTQADFTGGTNPLPHVVALASATVIKTHASYQNPFLAADVDNDGTVIPKDVLAVVNNLIANGTHTISGAFAGTTYVDANGDGMVSPQDVLKVVNYLLQNPSASVLASPQVMATPMFVPEPSTMVLASTGLVALATWGARRKRRQLLGPATA